MHTYSIKKMALANSLIFSGLCFLPDSASATSRLQSAEIRESEGLPCFSVPSNSETNSGLLLQSIVVTNRHSGNWRELPEELWSVTNNNSSNITKIYPKNCIRYGETPIGATQHALEPLELFRVYSVQIVAKNPGSNVIAYVGKFCVKPSTTKKFSIQSISPDERGGEKRYDICLKPR